jgi:hypothetical protein
MNAASLIPTVSIRMTKAFLFWGSQDSLYPFQHDSFAGGSHPTRHGMPCRYTPKNMLRAMSVYFTPVSVLKTPPFEAKKVVKKGLMRKSGEFLLK